MPNKFTPSTNQVEPPEVLLSAYYRSSDGKLHQINAHAPLNYIEALRYDVINTLNLNNEDRVGPVLVAIKGGKP